MKKPRPPSCIGRKRKRLGAALLTLGLLLAALWVWSGWSGVWFGYGTFDVRITAGEAHIAWNRPVMKTFAWDWTDSQRSPTFRWRGLYGFSEDLTPPYSQHDYGLVCVRSASGKPWGALVLLWPFPLVLIAAGSLLLRSGVVARWRAVGNLCASCGYDRAGLAADARCPECGKGAGA